MLADASVQISVLGERGWGQLGGSVKAVDAIAPRKQNLTKTLRRD